MNQHSRGHNILAGGQRGRVVLFVELEESQKELGGGGKIATAQAEYKIIRNVDSHLVIYNSLAVKLQRRLND
jgi:hypothetical protein